ncbi:hypothetical protein [Anaeromicrobium sediminis]|uniref:DUF4340 domain-containing protein n=1 Tax=Anaeromicrobium sediminis TaxID=1478221 RepID=A0A267MDL8_9FIRM|nr:hypothetical protein [Anaeromicrobium sediminis]PAB57649.1 hypothetical protein CCE28_18480 [Anaeromicrobium sediminis]
MKNTKVIVRLVILFLVLGSVSGSITFFILDKKKEVKEKSTVAVEEVKEEIPAVQEKDPFKEVVENINELYIECKSSPDNVIEVEEDKSDKIVALLKGMDLNLVMSSKEDKEKYSENLYTLHVKSENIKIKLNDKYIIVDNPTGGSNVYEGNVEEIQRIIDELGIIYVYGYSKHLRFNDVDKISILAKDVSRVWTLNNEEIQDFLENITLKKPIVMEENMNLSAIFPNYHIEVGIGDMVYNIKLLNEKTILIDSYDSKEFYEYDGELWNYLMDKYKIDKVFDRDSIEYLLNSTKIVIDDKDNIFDLEDEVFYPRELARMLIHSQKSETMVTPDESELKYTLTFNVTGEEFEVKIYENSITYKNKTYYSENIGEIIKSSMSI